MCMVVFTLTDHGCLLTASEHHFQRTGSIHNVLNELNVFEKSLCERERGEGKRDRQTDRQKGDKGGRGKRKRGMLSKYVYGAHCGCSKAVVPKTYQNDKGSND